MAPAAGQGFVAIEQMKAIDVPVFIVGVASDSIAPVKTNAAHYKKLIPQSKWYSIPGNAGHYIFLNEGNEDLKKNTPTFFKDPKGVDRKKIHHSIISLAVEFYKQYKII